MIKRQFIRKHIPGGEGCSCGGKNALLWIEEICESAEMSELQFYHRLSQWNRTGAGHWQYWAI